MPLPASIRPAVPADTPAILSLIRELAAYEKLSHACVATEDLVREHLFGPSPAAEALVADLPPAHGIVAYAIFFRTFSTFLARPGLYLEDIYVQPSHRGQGIGKALLVEVCRLAQTRGYGRVEWAVLNWNTPSIAFYESMGAVPLDEWRGYRLAGEALDTVAAGL
jgi:GNAT superfamily N-acetyltransferase